MPDGFLEQPARIPAADSLIGRTLGAYRVDALLGSGGMGEVYRAHDSRLGRTVALKVLPDLAFVPDRLTRFEREARTASSLNHPNIVTIYEVGNAAGRYFIAQEFIQGETLRERLAARRLTVTEVIDITSQVATALAAAHAAGIVHRDIKPENVMIRGDGYVKVLDFGLAKVFAGPASSAHEVTAEAAPTATRTGMILGTTRYMSPEQARGLEVDARSDIFTLGVMLYEMIAGRRPFDRATPSDVLAAILNDTPEPLNRSAAGDELQRIVSKALRKNPDERYQTAKDLVADLKVLAGGTASASLQSTRPAARRSILRWSIAAILVAAVAGAGWWIGSRRTPPFGEKATVLIADFANSTGEPVFDGGTLRAGLTAQLQQTPFLTLVPDEAIHTTLTMMGKPPDAAVTPVIAREICQRQGVPAAITGSIAKLGGHYVITLEATDAKTGGSIATEQQESNGQAEVLQALGRAATELRRKLGESRQTLQQYDAPIEQATTTSLEALKIFSAAMKEFARQNGAASQALFARAIDLDPNFGLAYSTMAWAWSMTGNLPQAAIAADKAHALRDRLTELEKNGVDSTYSYFVIGDEDDVLRFTGVNARLFPDHWASHSTMANTLAGMGRFDEVLSRGNDVIRLAPDMAQGYRWRTLALMRTGQIDLAAKTLDDAGARHVESQVLRAYAYQLALLKGDAAGADAALDSIQRADGEAQAWLARARTATVKGRWREASSWWLRAPRSPERTLSEAVLGYCQPTSEATEQLLAPARIISPVLAYLPPIGSDGSLCGDVRAAHRFGEELTRRYPRSTSVRRRAVPLFEAAAALFEHQPDRALAILDTGDVAPRLFWVNFLHGQANLRLLRANEAATDFQTIIAHREWDPLSPLYPLAHLGLARALAMSRDVVESRKAYEALFKIWNEADPDLPPLVAARAEYRKLL